MKERKENLKNEKEILEQIEEIKSGYKAQQIDLEKEELSFLDKFNKLVRLIFGDSSVSIYQALDKESLNNWKKKRFSRWLGKLVIGNRRNFLYFILLATITAFLVSEALSFYAIEGIFTTKTYIKAILTEVCFIFLSGYRAKGTLQTIWVNFLRVGIFCLMMFVISSQTFTIGTKGSAEIDIIQQQVEFLEKQIEEKDKEIVYYRDIKNWPRNTRERILEKETLVQKLLKLKEKQAKGKNKELSFIEKLKMYGRGVFRVLLLFISVLITRRIFRF